MSELLVPRSDLLEKIKPFYNNLDLVKVLTGMRRTGKSTLFELIKADISNSLHLKDNHFLSINFEDIHWRSLPLEEIHEKILHFAQQQTPSFVLLDEVQNVDRWEIMVNSLRQHAIASIFITGSNSKLLSGELATHLSGRYVSFEVFPFSFKEFVLCNKGNSDLSINEIFNTYLTIGGMPAWAHGFSKRPFEAWQQYVSDLFDTIFVKDIISRRQIRDVELFKKVLRYLFDQTGHPISIASLTRYLKSEGRAPSKETLANFIEAACEAFIFEQMNFETEEGKRMLAFNHKFYINDHGLRQALFLSNQINIDQILENIVAIELRRRGWKVSIGRIACAQKPSKELEVDFIARKNNQTLYAQVAYLLANKETEEREFGALLSIPDNFPKVVLSLDPILRPQKGIEHQDLRQWLLSEW